MTVASEAWALTLGALPVSEGFRMLEAAEVRFFSGGDAGRFEKLCGIRDLERFLKSDSAQTPRVRAVDNRRAGTAGIPYDEYSNDDGQIDLPCLYALYDAGATLVLSQMQQVHEPLGLLCRGLERIFLSPVGCNVYLTPPGAQGFSTHYDTHDVLILQVEGEKLWRYWPKPLMPLATIRTGWRSDMAVEGEPCTQLLRAGDVLYVPRGVAHDATSQGAQSSLHLTIGLHSRSWVDALRAALDVMEQEDSTLRQLFPIWRLAEGRIPDEIVQDASKRLTALGTVSVVELMSQQLLTKLATDRMPMVSRGLIAPTLSLTDRLYLSDTVHHFVVPHADGTAELRWAAESIPLTAEELSWIAQLDQGASAGDLGGPEALAFCQKLASAGLVSVQPVTPINSAE